MNEQNEQNEQNPNTPNPRAVARDPINFYTRASVDPGTSAHLDALGAAIPLHVLCDDAYSALWELAATVGGPVVDAYQHATGDWVVEVHGAYLWQEPRYTPSEWDRMYRTVLHDNHGHGGMTLADAWRVTCLLLAATYPNGQMVPTSWRADGEVRA